MLPTPFWMSSFKTGYVGSANDPPYPVANIQNTTHPNRSRPLSGCPILVVFRTPERAPGHSYFKTFLPLPLPIFWSLITPARQQPFNCVAEFVSWLVCVLYQYTFYTPPKNKRYALHWPRITVDSVGLFSKHRWNWVGRRLHRLNRTYAACPSPLPPG